MREYLYGFLSGFLAAAAVGGVMATSVGLSLVAASIDVGIDPFESDLWAVLFGVALFGGAAGAVAVRVRRRERVASANRARSAVRRVRGTKRVVMLLMVSFFAGVGLLYAISPKAGPLPVPGTTAQGTAEEEYEEGERVPPEMLSDSLEPLRDDAHTLQHGIETRVRQALLFAERGTVGGFVIQNELSANPHRPQDVDRAELSLAEATGADTASLSKEEHAALRSAAGLLRQGAWGRLAFAFERASMERELNRWLGVYHRSRTAVGPDTARVVLKASVLRAMGLDDRRVRSVLGRSVTEVQVERVERSPAGLTARLRARLQPAGREVVALARAYQRSEPSAPSSVRLTLALKGDRPLLVVRPEAIPR